jgi:hypothetical protein
MASTPPPPFLLSCAATQVTMVELKCWLCGVNNMLNCDLGVSSHRWVQLYWCQQDYSELILQCQWQHLVWLCRIKNNAEFKGDSNMSDLAVSMTPLSYDLVVTLVILCRRKRKRKENPFSLEIRGPYREDPWKKPRQKISRYCPFNGAVGSELLMDLRAPNNFRNGF